MSSRRQQSLVVGRLHAMPVYHQSLLCLTAARYGGLDLDVRYDNFGDRSNTDDNSMMPRFVSRDNKVNLFNANAIAYLLTDDSLRRGRDEADRALIVQWTHWLSAELKLALDAWLLPQTIANFEGHTLCETDISEHLHECLRTLDEVLKVRTFLAGERLSLADLSFFSICFYMYCSSLSSSVRDKYPHVTRLFTTVLHQCQVKSVLKQMKTYFHACEVDISRVFESVVDSVEFGKNPSLTALIDYPACRMESSNEKPATCNGKFSLSDFKVVYSSQCTVTVALPYLWDHFDWKECSVWVCTYRTCHKSDVTEQHECGSDELRLVETTENMVKNMFNAIACYIDEVFGSLIVHGDDQDHTLTGCWIFAGPSNLFYRDEDVNTRSYADRFDWVRCEDCHLSRQTVHAYLSWDFARMKTTDQEKSFHSGWIFK